MHRDDNGHLRIYVIYDNPKDMPGHVVVRAQTVGDGGEIIPDRGGMAFSFTSPKENEKAIEMARRHCMALGLGVVPRDPADEPHIVESWM